VKQEIVGQWELIALAAQNVISRGPDLDATSWKGKQLVGPSDFIEGAK